jgi:tetratricopeptide (TPR) repeat protein
VLFAIAQLCRSWLLVCTLLAGTNAHRLEELSGATTVIGTAVWNTYFELGSTAYEQGYYEMADKLLDAALEEAQRLGSRACPVAHIFNKLAYMYYQQKNYKKAELVYKRALALYERMPLGDDTEIGNLVFNLAELYFSQRKYLQALPLYERSLAIERERLGEDHVLLEKRLMKLSYIYTTQQRFEDAHQLYGQVKLIREKSKMTFAEKVLR